MTCDRLTGKLKWKNAKPEFEVLVAGDFCPRGNSGKLILSGKSNELLSEIQPELDKKDLALINLETPLLEQGPLPIDKSGSILSVPPGCLKFLPTGGWDVAACANNHIGDFGPQYVLSTIDMVKACGIATVGAGKDIQAAEKPLFLERCGLRIAILALAENEFGIAGPNKPGANPLRPLRNIAQIRTAATHADITLVIVHGGNEYNPLPSPRVVETYRAFVDAGASAVIGGHPHCPQSFEIYHEAPIIYSLGNFLFDTVNQSHKGYNWWYGYMVRIGLVPGQAVEMQMIPHHYDQESGRIRLLQNKERTSFFDYLNHLATIILSDNELQQYFDAWCLRDTNYFPLLGNPFMPVDWQDKQSVSKLMSIRNLHTCEAHCELITNRLRIIEENRQDIAAQYLPSLEILCNGQIPFM